MNWAIEFEYGQMFGELRLKTEFGPAFLRVRKIAEGIWAFKGGTISFLNEEWGGGLEIGYHRYFIKPDGSLVKKSGGIAGMNPYTYVVIDGYIEMRLWENKRVRLKHDGYDTIEYKKVLYRLSGGKNGAVIPLRSASSVPDDSTIENRVQRLLGA